MAEDWDPRAPRVQVSRPVQIDPAGIEGPTPGQARGPRWRRTTAGLFVPSTTTDAVVEQRIVEEAMRLRTGAVTGWAALRLLGGGYFDGLGADGRTRRPVPIASGRDRIAATPGIELHRVEVPEEEVVRRHGIPCVTAERALFDAMRWAPCLDDRVIAADMAAAAELTSIRQMHRYVLSRPRAHGRFLVLEALGWADEDARSPMEVRLRLIWTRKARWPRPLSNRPVLDLDGRLLGVPDLIDETNGVIGEYDGAEHRKRARHRRDVRREDLFRRAGLETFTVVGDDIDDEQLVLGRMSAARSRAGRQPRRWMLGPTGTSLDERLDARDHQRAIAQELPRLL